MLCNHPAPARAVCPAAPSPPCKCHSPAAVLLGDETLMSHHKSGANSCKRTDLAYQGVFFWSLLKLPSQPWVGKHCFSSSRWNAAGKGTPPRKGIHPLNLLCKTQARCCKPRQPPAWGAQVCGGNASRMDPQLTGMPWSCGLSSRLCSSFLDASIFSWSAASTMYLQGKGHP